MEILELPQYKTELARYVSVLPVCGISKEEAKDFFINFDKKEFDNPRRQIKKPMFFWISITTWTPCLKRQLFLRNLAKRM